MRRLAFAITFLAAALALPATAEAQFAGKWTLELGAWQTDGGDNVQIRAATSGIMELTVKGDSATGTWTTPGSTNGVALKGKIEGNKLAATGAREGRVNVNREASTVTITLTFDLTASGGELAGTIKMSGMGPGVSAPVKGKPAT